MKRSNETQKSEKEFFFLNKKLWFLGSLVIASTSPEYSHYILQSNKMPSSGYLTKNNKNVPLKKIKQLYRWWSLQWHLPSVNMTHSTQLINVMG